MPDRMVPLIECRRCPAGRGAFIAHGDRELAVFHLTDPPRFVVTDNSCPHASGNLSGGEIVEGAIECPWHQWRFSLSTGFCVESDRARVRVYRSEVREGTLFVDLDTPVDAFTHDPDGDRATPDRG